MLSGIPSRPFTLHHKASGRNSTLHQFEEVPMIHHRWQPCAMRLPPRLNWRLQPGPVQPRHALLVNPFYPKDPHASFGKHALTPTLALTSVAGATPPGWEVRYHDENLLQGPPP